MRFVMLSLLGLSVFYAHVSADPRPGKVILLKGGQASYINKGARKAMTAKYRDDHVLAELRQAELQTDDFEDSNGDSRSNRNTVAKASDSSARLFIRRFMRLKNLFGENNQPIIIRVFLNETSASPNIPVTKPTAPTNPTAPTGLTVPTVPTNPTAPTGVTVPTNPSAPSVPTVPTDPLAPTGAPVSSGPTIPTDPLAPTGAPVSSGPTMPTDPLAPTGAPVSSGPTIATDPLEPTGALVSSGPTIATDPLEPTGALVSSGPTIATDPLAPTRASVPTIPKNPLISKNGYLYRTDDNKTNSELPARGHYKHKVSNKNHAIIVRIPAKYKHLFNNGQQVKLSIKNGVKRRRVGNRRTNVNHNKQNSKKRMSNKNKLSRTISI